LRRIVEIWADAALQVQERDLKMMERLVRAQQRTAEAVSVPQHSNVVPMWVASAATGAA